MVEILVMFGCPKKIIENFKPLGYGCVLYSFEVCDTEISNMHFFVKYLNFTIL